jgi:hypothetical protein
MTSTSEMPNQTTLSKDARREVAGAFDALAQWRDEISAANQRCLTKAVDQMATAQRAIGWPEPVIAAAREPLLKTAQVQTHMVDQIMDAWEQQLKSVHDLSGIAQAAKPRMPPSAGSPFAYPSPFAYSMSDMMHMSEMALVPFRLWLQAAEQWRRNWADLMSPRTGPPRQGPTKPGDAK